MEAARLGFQRTCQPFSRVPLLSLDSSEPNVNCRSRDDVSVMEAARFRFRFRVCNQPKLKWNDDEGSANNIEELYKKVHAAIYADPSEQMLNWLNSYLTKIWPYVMFCNKEISSVRWIKISAVDQDLEMLNWLNSHFPPIFVKLLGSPSDDVREQAVWALGNVAGDSPKCLDLVLGYGALLPLLAQLNEHAKISMLRNATWALSNFCRGKPQPPFDQVKPALPALERLVHSNDEEVLTDACWALSYLSDGTNDKIQAVIESGVVPRLIELLLHPAPTVLIPALRTIGNLVTGDDAQTQMVIDCQALRCLLSLLTGSYKKSIKKEACWTISNITAGNKDQIQAVIEAGIFGPLIYLLQTAEFEIKKEAAWAISNATSGGTHEQIKFLVDQGCIKSLCDLLTCPDARIVTVCLEGLENILKVGEAGKVQGSTGGVNLYAQLIDEADGLDKIENLQTHDNTEIYEKSVKMLETYWCEEDEEDVMPPGDVSQTGFNFGGASNLAPANGFQFS